MPKRLSLSWRVLSREAERVRPRRAGRGRDLFDAFVRSRCRRQEAFTTDLVWTRALARAVTIIRVPLLRTWVDLVRLYARFLAALPANIAALAARGLLYAGEQLSREGALPGRPRHGQSAPCLGCGRTRQIRCVHRLLCPRCIGAQTLTDRFAGLCSRIRPTEPIRQSIVDMLIGYENANGITTSSFTCVRHLSIALVRMSDVSPLRTWKDLAALRAGINATLTPAMANHGHWAVVKLSKILLAQGVLPHRPMRSTGLLQDQLRASLVYFDDNCPVKRRLLTSLIDYYISSRVTIAAVQVVHAFAYYLVRNPAPLTTSWRALLDEGRRVLDADGCWASRIHTALLRIGDELEWRGELPAREHNGDLTAILRRLSGDDAAAVLGRRCIVDLHRHHRRPSTLLGLAATLSPFWDWARGRGMTHPAQISRDTVQQYIREHMSGPGEATRRNTWCASMHMYFRWLRREQLVLHNPIPAPPPHVRPTVRVATRRAIEDVVRALVDGRLAAEAGLLVYLVLFHGVRNFEAARLCGLGYQDGVYRVAVPSVPDQRSPRPTRRDTPVLALPTDRYPWLRAIVDSVLDGRAAKLKHPNTPYLFVCDLWRRRERPMTDGSVTRRVTMATERVVGVRLTPVLLRDTGATLAADASDHTMCLRLGWSPSRAIDFGFARREVVALSVDEQNGTCDRKTKRPSAMRAKRRGKRP